MTRAINVRSFYPFSARVQDDLRRISPRLRIDFSPPDGQARVDALADDTEVLLSTSGPSDLSKLPALKWLALAGAGVNHLRLSDLAAHGVVTTNASGLNAPPMAEFAMTGILLFSQRVGPRLENQQRHGWPSVWSPEWNALLGTGLRGTTVTIVGYGSVGREVARLARAFGMRVLAIKADPAIRRDTGYSLPGVGDVEGVIPERFGDMGAVAAFFGASDYVVVTVPFTPATRWIVDRAALSALPRHAVVLNIARGGVLDEAALADALRAGALRGAVLDVVEREPLAADSPLWNVPNLVLAPHVSGVNDLDRWYDGVGILMGENLRRYAAGEPLLNVVDPARGY